MDNQDIIYRLNEWMVNFVEKPNPLLNNWAPCPYARQARVNNSIKIEFSETTELKTTIFSSIYLLDTVDVVVICFDHEKIDPIELQKFVAGINQILIPKNYVILEDHPHAPEYINGAKMNFGECGLLLMQKADKLAEASSNLKEKGYYSVWSKENMEEVVNWR